MARATAKLDGKKENRPPSGATSFLTTPRQQKSKRPKNDEDSAEKVDSNSTTPFFAKGRQQQDSEDKHVMVQPRHHRMHTQRTLPVNTGGNISSSVA